MKKQQSKRVIPGFGLTMGVTLAMLSIVVLIPLASLAVYSARLGFREFIEVITRPRVLSGFYVKKVDSRFAAQPYVILLVYVTISHESMVVLIPVIVHTVYLYKTVVA